MTASAIDEPQSHASHTPLSGSEPLRSRPPRVLVTGATGFVGSTLTHLLAQAGYRVRAALRTDREVPTSIAEKYVVGDIGSNTDRSAALADVDAVIHAAARVHMMREVPGNADLHAETNTNGTGRLAEAAAKQGVSRFIFLSSVKVNGEETSRDQGFSASDVPHPQDAYGRSKWRAEQALHECAARTGLQFQIIRCPLVYGPGVRANFLRLLNWVDGEVPLPFGAIRNRRSLVNIWNLCDLILYLLRENVTPNQTLMVADNEDVSTPELIQHLADALNRRARLIPVPVRVLEGLGGIMGKRAEVHRLCGSLAVDIGDTVERLGWHPPVRMDEALDRTVAWYRQRPDARAS